MNRSKVQADDLFFFDNKGENSHNLKPEDELVNDIGELILSSSDDESQESDSICSLNDSYTSDDLDSTDQESSCYSDTDSCSDDEEDDEEEENIPLILPDHACVYCNVFNPLCVAKCVKCSKWFCNSQKGTLSSHLINHLIKSGHKEVALHPDSPVGDATLECYNCGCKNIFLLGYIKSKEDDVIVLLCRQPCAFNAPKESDWNVDAWTPLIGDRRLLSWLCQYPSQSQEARARKISFEQVNKLESAWKSGMITATLEDINRREQEDVLEPTRLSYSDPHEFKSIMIPLITAEAKIERDLKEAQKLDNVTIRWDTGLNKKTIVWFPRPVSEAEFKINTGDEVIIRHPNPTLTTRNWYAVGVIIDIPQNLTSEIPVEIKPGYKCYTSTTIGYGIEFVWNSAAFDRMRAAIETLVLDAKCMSLTLLDLLMGNRDFQNNAVEEGEFEPLNLKNVSVPNLPSLNHSQAHAVRCALQRPLTLIQGPPGTGKTVTSASIVYHLAQRGPVLVVASSNIAVDHLTEKIHQSGLRVVRITAKARETLSSSVSFLSLHVQARTISKDSELDRLYKLKSEIGQLSMADERKYLELQKKAEKLVLDAAQVICCTCVGAGDPRVLSRRFSSVLIDEATQATEPEALISLVHGVNQVIMVGDHRQLGPIMMNKACAKAGFDRSMFERLMQSGIRPIRLQVQYRMHPALSEFPSNMFYDGSLQNGVTINERIRPELDFPWPNPNVPMFLLSCFGSEELASTGTSFLNRIEASAVEKIVTKLLKGSVHPSQIGVITPYQGQRAFIMQMMIMNGTMNKELYEAVEVASVDAFQGREKDYIILSCVRSNDNSNIGFVSDARRMNVALTRARYGLIILGNPKVLSKNHHWNNLICHFKELQVLMEGNIGNLQPSPLHFSRSTNHHQSRGNTARTEEALNRHGRSAFYSSNDNDDNVSLHSFVTDVFFNDNLSQLSQEDYEDNELSDN